MCDKVREYNPLPIRDFMCLRVTFSKKNCVYSEYTAVMVNSDKFPSKLMDYWKVNK